MLRLSAEAAAAAPGAALHLVTLGPLTNLALALRKEPALSQRLGAVVVMGGCGNARGNASPTSEFNIRADPESAEEVIAALAMPAGSQQKVSVVPWELTEDYPLPWRWFDAALPACLGGGGSTVRRFLAAVVRNSYGAAASGQRKGGGAVICDALAVAVCLDRAAVVTAEQTLHCTVECAGVYTRGQTVCDWDEQVGGFPHKVCSPKFTVALTHSSLHDYHIPCCWKQPPNVRWVTAVDVPRYQRLLEMALEVAPRL